MGWRSVTRALGPSARTLGSREPWLPAGQQRGSTVSAGPVLWLSLSQCLRPISASMNNRSQGIQIAERGGGCWARAHTVPGQLLLGFP